MRVALVNCFDTYEDRIDLIHDVFIDLGHSVTVVQSDFRHFKKVHRTDDKQDFIFVKSRPYYKNISKDRLISHYDYAKRAFGVVEDINPDLLYVVVPPNSLAKFAAQYKKKHKNVKLIFDLIDLWPETMPVGRIKNVPLFNLWKLMRDRSLKYSDYVITECDLYKQVLEKQLVGLKTKTLYLAKREVNVCSNPKFNEYEVHLCYLGSINNIIDIQKIKRLVKLINTTKPVTLHAIGDGESRDTLISSISETGASVIYHGEIYDPQKKQDIFDECQFGLNIMKETVCVGLTMKSIDYFQAGLPFINSIKADTTQIVDRYNVGFNITDSNIDNIANKIANIKSEELITMRENTKKTFNELFSLEAFNTKLKEVIKELLNRYEK